MSTNTTAVYAGSFDPVTKGHIDLIERAARVFDKVVVGVGVNSAKKYLFSEEERITLIRQSLPITMHVEVLAFQGLLVDFCHKVGSKVIIRGLRAVTDFEVELGIAHANANLAPDIDTFFLPTQPQFSFVSSSTVKEIARYAGRLDHYVPTHVAEAIVKKMF
jgi:pantetheine-phosphate adenylyltransferase